MADKDEDKRRYEEWKTFDARTLDTLRGLGFDLKPIELPISVPVNPLAAILTAEAACAFDALLRDGARRNDGAPGSRRVAERVPPGRDGAGGRVPARAAPAHDRHAGDGEGHGARRRLRRAVVRRRQRAHDQSHGAPGRRGARTASAPWTERRRSITFQGRLDDDDLALAVADAYQQRHRLPHCRAGHSLFTKCMGGDIFPF